MNGREKKAEEKKKPNVDPTDEMSELRKYNVRCVVVSKDTVEDVTVAEPHLTIERERRWRVFHCSRFVEHKETGQGGGHGARTVQDAVRKVVVIKGRETKKSECDVMLSKQ